MTHWSTKRAGDPDSRVYDVSDELGEGALLLADRPDWVRRPDTGEQLRVLEATVRRGPCLACSAEVAARVLVLEGELDVMECPSCRQFLWFRRPEGA